MVIGVSIPNHSPTGAITYQSCRAKLQQERRIQVEVSCNYEDTCLGCYLTDHHNRQGELLLGIYPHSQTESEAASELLEELNSSDWDLPEALTDDLLKAAFSEAVKGVDFRYIDKDGQRVEELTDAEEDHLIGESSQVWFVLTWSVP